MLTQLNNVENDNDQINFTRERLKKYDSKFEFFSEEEILEYERTIKGLSSLIIELYLKYEYYEES